MLELEGQRLTLAEVARVARGEGEVSLAAAARERMAASRAAVERIVAESRVVYGVNTGFGKLSDVTVPADELRELQLNLVRSHACGVGDPLPAEETRAMMLLRANVLAKGFSGARAVVAETLLAMLARGVHPVVPELGSVGASGDLAPLAHLALCCAGEGEAVHGGERLPGGEALRRAGIEPLRLEAKEGLALLNGTQALTAVGALALERAERVARTADVSGAMSLEALKGTPAAFDERIHLARPHEGQVASAAHLRELLQESEIRASHLEGDPRVQDAYSLRCMPQVHGAARDALAELGRVLAVELNAATDNPLVFPTGEVVSGGNFHGEPLALALDYATLAVTELASISERRTARLVDAHLSGLPAFLAERPGVESGLMIAHYTAAALVNELQSLSHPASVDTIPTSANQEDHVSMGATSALHLRDAIDRAEQVLAIEALCAAQGLDFRAPLRPGKGVARAHAAVRERVPHLAADRSPAPDIGAVRDLVHAGELLANGATQDAHA